MATVYLAADERHDRKVAIKVLKPELAAVVGAERFLAEIRTTANLQHPHILPLFDSGEADSFLFYVMPYVEGETLQQRLDREKQLPVEDAIAIARKVCGALQAAHDRGVIHRDIKPANILMSNGEPLVADFGIALAVQQAGGGRLTETGMSLGTPYYMSPEQATADRDPDSRSDVYSVACVLYEMLTGEPPFTGNTAQAVLGRILTTDPARPTELRRAVPPHVEAAILRALEKMPADRFSSADEFARSISDSDLAHQPSSLPRSAGRAGRPRWGVFVGTAALALAIGGWLGLNLRPDEARDVGLPFEAPMQGGFSFPAFDVSPDGTFIIYEGRGPAGVQLWYRSLVDDEARSIPGTEGAMGSPRISPDGDRVAFASGGALHIVAVEGGPVSTVADVQTTFGGGWLEDGLIFFADGDGRILRWIDPESGPARELNAEYCILPTLIAVDEVLCGGGGNKYAHVRRLDETIHDSRTVSQTGTGSRLRGSRFQIVDSDYLVYTSIDGSLMATRFVNRDSLQVGRSVALVPNLRRQLYTGAGEYEVTSDGALVYAPGPNTDVGNLVRNDLAGRREVLPGVAAAHLRFSPSPDGHRLASVVEGIQQQELRIYDLASGDYRLVAEHVWIGYPIWGAEGDHLIYPRSRRNDLDGEELILHRFDAVGEPRVLLTLDAPAGLQPGSYLSPDSLLIGAGSAEISPMIMDVTQNPVHVDTLDFKALFVSISPDRRWLAWGQPGTTDVYVTTWPAQDRRWTVARGVIEPRWLSDGRLIFFDPEPVDDGTPIFGVTFRPDTEPPFGEPEVLVRDPRRADTPGWSVAVTHEDEVIYLQTPDRINVSYLRVIPGWVDEMKRAVDEANSPRE